MRMSKGIESTIDLRKDLVRKGVLPEVEKLDVKDRTSNRTYKKRLKNRYRNPKTKQTVCAYCGKHIEPLDAAHIEPVEIGGPTSEENLILLCKNCHNAYDKGALSISAMKKIAKGWKCKRRIPLKEPMGTMPEMIKPPRGLDRFVRSIRKMETERTGNKATKAIDKKLRGGSLTEAQKSYIQILQAEMIRRGAGKNAVRQALKRLDAIDLSKVPAKHRAYYHYERGYMFRLLGRHVEARRCMGQSAKAARLRAGKKGLCIDYVAASANAILCELARRHRVTPQKAMAFLRSIVLLAGIAGENSGYWGGRWELNCAVHNLQVRIKANDKRGSWRALRKMLKIYRESDTKTGWAAGARQTVSLLEGIVHARFHRNCAELYHGVRLLARSFMGRIRDDRQKAEGIRDAGIELANILPVYNRGNASIIRTAKRLEKEMLKFVDGTSVLWPWRA